MIRFSFPKPARTAFLISLLLVFSAAYTQPISFTYGEQKAASLVIWFAPPKLPADGGTYDAIVVQLVDEKGLPMPAPFDVNVTLTSSRVEIGNVEPFVLIKKGATFGTASFTTTFLSGDTDITASASGYLPDTKTLTTIQPSGTPAKLSLVLGPPQLLSEAGSGLIVVQLLDVSNMPSRTQKDIVVTVSSSVARLGRVESNITIKAGETFGKTKFYTDYLVGETTITASAPGFPTVSATLKVIGSEPKRLQIYASPSKIPERSGGYSLITVQLQDLEGKPARAPSDVVVTITSSDNKTAYPDDPFITIPKGKSYASTKLYGVSIGVVEVTATAQGFGSATTKVTIIRPNLGDSGKLKLYLAPPTILPLPESHELVVVQLVDEFDEPLIAADDVDVYLSSSETSVGTVDHHVKVLKGTPQAIARLNSTFLAGSTIITASASNFLSASIELRVAGRAPYQLFIRPIPAILPADGKKYEAIVVELQDSDGLPVRAPYDVEVYLSSSRSEVGTVSTSIVIPKGATHAFTYFQTTFVAGETNITAFAIDYAPAPPQTVKTVKPAPSQLAVYVAPKLLMALPAGYDIVVVQLQDALGIPAKARSDLQVFFSSSSLDVGDVDNTAIIKAGSTYVKTKFYPTGKEGKTTITATASGLAKGSTELSTVLLPLKAKLFTNIKELDVRGEAKLTIFVESDGRALANATVSWEASMPKLIKAENLTNKDGYASATYRPSLDGDVSIIVKVGKLGYMSDTQKLSLKVKPLRFTVSLLPEKTRVEVGAPISIEVRVKDELGFVEGAKLVWSTSLGQLAKPSNITDKEGKGSAIFFSNKVGSANITVKVSKAGYIAAQKALTINITQPPPPPPSQQPPEGPKEPRLFGLTYLQLSFIGGGVAAAAFVVFFFRLRRKRPTGVEEEYV